MLNDSSSYFFQVYTERLRTLSDDVDPSKTAAGQAENLGLLAQVVGWLEPIVGNA